MKDGQREDTLIIELKVQPGASKVRVDGVIDGRFRICIAAPPVDGKANDQLIRFLAAEFRVGKSRVKLLRGKRGREKRVAITSPRRIPDWFSASS